MSSMLTDIYNKVEQGIRISENEALVLLQEADFLRLGQLADVCRKRFHPTERVTFNIDRNINYTNICESQCRFCAFFRKETDDDAYLLTPDEILAKVSEAVDLGATQIMLQGGLHPGLKPEYLEEVFRKIKAAFDITIHSLSPPEIHHLAQLTELSIEAVLVRLQRAGLDSLPGGGAEILEDRVRREISPHKVSADTWLAVMETAHHIGMKTTATMMMGSVETVEERIVHMQRVRDVQDRTSGFRAFIPWTFKSHNTELGGQEVSSIEYLRTMAVARIYLDNIQTIQGSWVTQGRDIGQMSIHFGANDLGSIMLEENVVRAAGVQARISEMEMVELIRRSGKVPEQRNTEYKTIKTYP